MIIKNRWKAVLAAKNITQAEIADMTGQTKPFISGVVNGVSVLPYDDLASVCARLGVEAAQIYPDDVMAGVYGTPSVRKKRQEIVNIKLRGEMAQMLNALREAHGMKTNVDTVAKALRDMSERDSEDGRTV